MGRGRGREEGGSTKEGRGVEGKITEKQESRRVNNRTRAEKMSDRVLICATEKTTSNIINVCMRDVTQTTRSRKSVVN